MNPRWWHGLTAALVLVAIVIQVVIALRVSGSPHETTTGLLRGSSAPGRIIRVLSFFTIQSNLLSGLVSAQLALRPDRDGPVWRAVRLAALIGITVTGIVYSAVLADIHEPAAGAETFVNDLVHYVVPVMMVVGWVAFGPRPRCDATTLRRSLAFPALWLAYTMIRGAVWDWYPYPFLDVRAEGYARVLLNSAIVTLVLAVIAGLYTAGDRRLPMAPTPKHDPSPLTTTAPLG